MDTSIWIGIYMPMFIIFFVVIPNERRNIRKAIIKIKKRKRGIIMTNEIIKKYVGEKCRLSTGSFGTTIVGKIIEVNENWIEVETKKNKEIINADFIQNIKIL